MKMDLECGHDRKNHQRKSTTHTHKNAKSTFIVDDSVTTKFSAKTCVFFRKRVIKTVALISFPTNYKHSIDVCERVRNSAINVKVAESINFISIMIK